MQYIDKKLAIPIEVESWIAKTKPKQWNLSQEYNEGYKILREQLRQEQYGLCCYCCQALVEKATIEHLKNRDKHPKLTYEYDNLLLSCQTSNQCDNAKGNQNLDLTPLMIECDTEIKINLAGELETKSERAGQAIRVLNLNNSTLCEKRKRKIDMISFTFDPNSTQTPIDIMDKDTLSLILQSLDTPVEYQEFQYILKKLA